MAEKPGTKQDKAAAEKKTRKVLTAAERIAAAKQAVADLEAKEASKAKAKVAGAQEKVDALVKRRDDVQSKLNTAEAELAELKSAAGESDSTEPEPETITV